MSCEVELDVQLLVELDKLSSDQPAHLGHATSLTRVNHAVVEYEFYVIEEFLQLVVLVTRQALLDRLEVDWVPDYFVVLLDVVIFQCLGDVVKHARVSITHQLVQ